MTPTAFLDVLVFLYVVSAAICLFGFERARRNLIVVFKPLTTALLLPIIGAPTSTFRALAWAGVIASVGGDLALLRAGNGAFLVGLGFFLVAHLTYVVAFATVAAWSPPAWTFWAALVLMAAATPLLLRTLWPRVEGLRGPVLAYGTAISVMVVAAAATVGGPLAGAPLAAAGALLFYVSDASLAINRFVRPIPHPALLNVGVYWLGQLGIALAARSMM
jgi:alkenylglycerophosphocholine hydrolase